MREYGFSLTRIMPYMEEYGSVKTFILAYFTQYNRFLNKKLQIQ